MDDTTNSLQAKIEKAKRELSEDTLYAISAVPWQAEILKMRETKGYSFEQLGDLETETELLLCGLVSPQKYPQELEARMKITKVQANDLVNEMNEKVFKKIKEELIKNTERKKVSTSTEKVSVEERVNTDILSSAGIEIINKEEIPSKNEEPHPILAQKLSGPMKIPAVKTEHTLDNITKAPSPQAVPKAPTPPAPPKTAYTVDPYRMKPE
ncbi:MAG: hypothetical protein WCT44_00750 [Candidatus Paceibacterota bacterium]